MHVLLKNLKLVDINKLKDEIWRTRVSTDGAIPQCVKETIQLLKENVSDRIDRATIMPKCDWNFLQQLAFYIVNRI